MRGDDYELWNLIPGNLHLFGVDGDGVVFLFGTDQLGRDLFSRNLHAARVSLSIGLVGVAISFVLGCALGGISGYYGGVPDLVIQRVIEFLISIPTIPLWMALSAALPPRWTPIQVYFGITIILSVIGWSGLARVVRGRLLELREEDFVTAARISGASEPAIIIGHLLPSFMSYLVVHLTLRIPWMILGETSLSFLGLGIRPPAVSWGALLKEGENIRILAHAPWLLIPGLFVVVAVLAFSFVGDGLRSPEYLELSRKIYAFHADNLYMIGTVGMAPTLYIAKNSIGNVPTEYPPPRSWAGDLTSYADQLFFRQ